MAQRIPGSRCKPLPIGNHDLLSSDPVFKEQVGAKIADGRLILAGCDEIVGIAIGVVGACLFIGSFNLEFKIVGSNFKEGKPIFSLASISLDGVRINESVKT